MQTKLGLACRVGWLSLLLGFTATACGDDASSGAGRAGAAGESAGGADGGLGSPEGGADSSSAAGTSNGVGSGGRGGSKNVPVEPEDPVQPGAAGGGSDSPDFDGVDLSEVPADVAPSGCVGGFDPELGALVIELGDEVSVARLSVVDGVLHANGVACESAAGDPAKAERVLSLEVTGGSGDEQLFLDLSEGEFTGCFSEEGAFRIALGEGDDVFSLLGTLGPDVITAGSDGGALVLDANDDQRVDITVEGAPKVVISTGAMNDVVRADGAALGVDPAALPLWLYGGGAGDELAGGSAADYLFGGIGNDWLDAGSSSTGGDTFDGGEGNDVVDFSARSAALSITMGAGADDGEPGEDADVRDSVEDLLGGQGENDVTGGPASNRIWGGPAADRLSGGAGDDTLIGNAGDDVLHGDAGDDTLYGEEGNDALFGDAGDDLLDGGEGKDSLDGGEGDGDICLPVGGEIAKACEL